MALTISPPRPPRVAARGQRGLLARLLAVVLTVLTFATLLCGTAMAVEMPAGMGPGHPAPHASRGDHGFSGAGMSGQGACEECVREDGRGHCDRGLPEGVRGDSADSGPCAAPAPGRVPVAAAPVRAATADVRRSPASRPWDLHQLQVLRV